MKRLSLTGQEFEQREGYERAVLFDASDFANATKLQLMRLAPGQTIKPHHHNVRTECFRLVAGDGSIKINGEVVASSPDDVVLCAPGEVHEFINNSETEYLLFQVIRTNDPKENDMFWEENDE